VTSECDICKDLRQEVTIHSRRQLGKAHQVVMGNIADGTIVEAYVPFFNEATKFAALFGVDRHHFEDPPRIDFASLMQARSFEDVGYYYFRCTSCQLMFKFSARPDQPSGRTWSPVYDESILNQP
jgi:hypothetical protein